ncbi:MAG: LacI family DNA-binding transcriptional regulator [Phycisphaerae bacterium]|nr:LacI family DNA-binding transcriptional regulator [Phycisphaerae bacterium]
MAVTMKQVATKANVSDTTVARVLDGYPHISPDIIDRVNQAISELGYVPKRNARRNPKKTAFNSNKKIKTGLVGFLLVQWTPDYLSQPLMAQIMAATERHLSMNNLQMVFTQLPDPDTLPPLVTRQRFDGVLLMGQVSPKLKLALAGHNVVLMLGGPRHTGDDYWADGIGSDYPACGYMAAKYLIDRNHKKIAYLNPVSNHGGFQEIGWSFQATTQHHHEPIDCMMLTCDFNTSQSGIFDRDKALKSIKDQIKIIADMHKDDRPTGLHVPADDSAVLVYQALKSFGIAPGVDIDIISRRNQEIHLSQMHPRPATIDLNTDEMGRRAIEKLLSRIANPTAPVGARVLIPPKLVMPG